MWLWGGAMRARVGLLVPLGYTSPFHKGLNPAGVQGQACADGG